MVAKRKKVVNYGFMLTLRVPEGYVKMIDRKIGRRIGRADYIRSLIEKDLGLL